MMFARHSALVYTYLFLYVTFYDIIIYAPFSDAIFVLG